MEIGGPFVRWLILFAFVLKDARSLNVKVNVCYLSIDFSGSVNRYLLGLNAAVVLYGFFGS